MEAKGQRHSDASLTNTVNSENESSSSQKDSPFTIENIPYGIISTEENLTPRCATAFERNAVDLQVLEEGGLFQNVPGFGTGIFSQV